MVRYFKPPLERGLPASADVEVVASRAQASNPSTHRGERRSWSPDRSPYFEEADIYLEGAEGTVLPELLFIGRPFLPTLTADPLETRVK